MLGYFSLVRDVTRRLKEEQQQQQSQKMEALGNLVGGIAHDFNNVLGVISAYAEINALTESTDQGKANLQKIVKATQRGADLCHQILTFSKDMSVDQHVVEMTDILDETSRMLRAMIPNHIELIFEQSDKQMQVMANPTQMQQVIINLATNASLAIGESNGEIHLELSSVDLHETRFLTQGMAEPGSYVVLRVTDNGCGMTRDEISRIFEPFYTTRDGEGTGMGLAIVYKIVRAHGAAMNLKSIPGEGTEFEVYIPLYKGDAGIPSWQPEEDLIHGHGEKILLVDDEEELLGSMSELLTKIGYQVSAFLDSSAALEKFRDNPDEFELIVSDQMMPGMTGTTLLKAIRELRQDIPCIVCTGHSDLLEGTDVSGVAIEKIMRKPFTASEISRHIFTLLSDNPQSEDLNQNSISAVST